jgi:hypothetical protein
VTAAAFLRECLGTRLRPAASEWLDSARAEVTAGVDPERFAALFALTSRHVPRAGLSPSDGERAAAGRLLAGWNPERWDQLDAARAGLVLALPDPAGLEAELLLEEALRFADMGELVAAYRALPLLPEPQRFAWRMGEGARSNMRAVFEAACCDTPFPVQHFGDVAWRSAVLKSLFVGAPLWRIWGLDGRLDAELARMALDFADERRSAGREVPHELWLCLGAHGAQRARSSMELELAQGSPRGRAAAALGLARAGATERVRELAARETDARAAGILKRAIAGERGQTAFAALENV